MAPCASYVAGQFGNQGIQFTGGQSIIVPNTAALQVTQWTTNIWIDGTGRIMSDRFFNVGHDSFGLDMYYDGNTISMTIGNVNGGWWDYSIAANVGALPGWHMITTTVSDTGFQFYVDGVAQSADSGGAGSWGTSPGNGPIFIEPFDTSFALGGTQGGSFVGGEQEFHLYGSVLSSTDISNLFSNEEPVGNGALLPVQCGAVGQRDASGPERIQSDRRLLGGRRPGDRRHGDQQLRHPGGPHPGDGRHDNL